MFEIRVQDIAERKQILGEKIKAALGVGRLETFYQHISGPVDLPVIDLEIGLPLYRVANYRTQTRQRTHLRTKRLPDDFFKAGEENASVQKAQHEILVEYAKEGSGETIVPIFDVLRNGRQQSEPLLITSDGVVVNGNRRIAAMRELYAEDPTGYAGFSNVRVKVLPDGLTAVEIKRIETRLQMTPQTLLPYDWVNKALAIRDLREWGLKDPEIKAEMKLDDADEIKEAVEELAEAELYLAEYLNAASQYEKVIPQKQQFIELRKALSRTKDSVEKELARKISYVLTYNSDDLGSRAYDYRIAYGSEMEKVVPRLSDRLGVPLAEDSASPDEAAVDLFDDGTTPLSKYAPLLDRLSDVTQSKAISEEIAEICNNIRESQQQQNLSKAALQKATKAHTLLTEINLQTAAPSTLPSVAAQLSSIISRATALLNGVNQRKPGS